MQKIRTKFQTDFRKSRLKMADITVLTIYILLSLFFWLVYKQELIAKDILRTLVPFYYFTSAFLLLVGYYRQLRNYKVYILWLVIGAVQFAVYVMVKENPDFMMYRGTNLTSMRMLFIMLLSFQLFR